MADHKNSKSNYDRWKPGTKLACMMSLKQVCQDPKFYDPSNNRFNSLTWHTVAENLNKEYPHYAKRFTNINVKDRYDRVLKHHKVFKRMANNVNGFIWNPKSFCFEMNEDLIKQYEQGYIKDDIISNDLNIARFLSKPGHIDLEYYHRYIYQFTNQEELRTDAIIQSPSFIEDAISKGILNLVTTSSFISKTEKQLQQQTPNNEYQPSPILLQNQPTHHQSSSSSNATNSSNSIPSLSNISNSRSQIANNSISSQSTSNSLVPATHPTTQHQLHHQLVPNPQAPPPQPHPPPVSSTHPGQPPHSSDLDFSGLINQEPSQNSSNTHGHHHNHPNPTSVMNPNVNMPLQMTSQEMIPGSVGSTRGSHGGQPPFKKPRTTSVPSGSSSVVSTNIIGTGIIGESYETMLAGQGQGPIPSKYGLSSGEAILQLHKEFDMMRNLVNEQILNLRLQKLINFQEFNQIQTVQNLNDQFIRSAYKRIGDDSKLIDLINVYLNKID